MLFMKLLFEFLLIQNYLIQHCFLTIGDSLYHVDIDQFLLTLAGEKEISPYFSFVLQISSYVHIRGT